MSERGKQKEVKKKVHYVPSRYKQAVEKTSIQSSNSREKSTFLKVSRDNQVSGNSSQDTLNYSKVCVPQGNRGMTSTPTSKGDFLLPSLDASAVTDTKGYLTVPHLKEGIGLLSTDSMKMNLIRKNRLQSETLLSHGPVIVSHKDKKKNKCYNEKVAEAQMDLLYAQYLQAAMLESESKKALQMRTSYALEIIHKLFGLVMVHMEKARTQRCKLQIVTAILKIHEHCQKQEEIFKPIFEIIPTLENQYTSLAEAVNSTKHKLHVKNILIPEPGSEGEIIELLHKMGSFIEAFCQEFNNITEISLSADSLQNYISAAEQISAALKSGLNLISEAKDLILSEASLALGCQDL